AAFLNVQKIVSRYTKEGLVIDARKFSPIAMDVIAYCYPEFQTDWQPLVAPLLLQAKGQSSIEDRIFEDRLRYWKELSKMGTTSSTVTSENGQSVHFRAPQISHGAEVRALDIRAGAIDVYETDEKLVVKARTAGVNKQDLDVSISDGILTISGTFSSGDDSNATQWHIQECYWGEFSRTLALPVAVKEEEVEAVLKDGVLTVSFNKVKQEQARRIEIQ
ncbi:heat shock protein Hsp20, partial [candidate division TM7 genomosp. GTL1]